MPQQQCGFTILEVLVAFLVAALLLSVILSGFSTGMSQLVRADRISQAAIVAQSRLAEVGVVQPLQAAQYKGHDVLAPEFSWEINIEPFTWEFSEPLAQAGATLYRVDIEVFWPSGGKIHSFVLSSLRLGREE
ncbi:MAG: type II secretion system protein [Pseudomonas sp.]|nr:type II secretion system protein [Pseudomonas sp.]